MAVITKDNRQGLDVVIDYLQDYTFARLISSWSVGATYVSYPRANKIYKTDENGNESLIPEISLDAKNYQEVLFSDKVSVSSFFLESGEKVYNQSNDTIKQSLSVIFQANLVELYGLEERADEIFNNDILTVFSRENRNIYSDIVLEQGIDNVYSDISLSQELREKIKLSDMSQRHVVKLTFSILYKIACNPSISKTCAPVLIKIDGTNYGYIVSGATEDINIVDSEDNTVDSTIVNGKVVVLCSPPTGGTYYLTTSDDDILTTSSGDRLTYQ